MMADSWLTVELPALLFVMAVGLMLDTLRRQQRYLLQ